MKPQPTWWLRHFLRNKELKIRNYKDTLVPEFRMYIDRNRLAEYGLSAGEVAEELKWALWVRN